MHAICTDIYTYILVLIIPDSYRLVQRTCGYDGLPDAHIHTGDLASMKGVTQIVKCRTTGVLSIETTTTTEGK